MCVPGSAARAPAARRAAHAQGPGGRQDRASLTLLPAARQLYGWRPGLERHGRLGALRQHGEQPAEPDQHRGQQVRLQRASSTRSAPPWPAKPLTRDYVLLAAQAAFAPLQVSYGKSTEWTLEVTANYVRARVMDIAALLAH